MINLDIIAHDLCNYSIEPDDHDEAVEFWRAVHDRFPATTTNWGGPPSRSIDFGKRCFLFMRRGVDVRLYHGIKGSYPDRISISVSEMRNVPELPGFDIGDISIDSLLGV